MIFVGRNGTQVDTGSTQGPANAPAGPGVANAQPRTDVVQAAAGSLSDIAFAANTTLAYQDVGAANTSGAYMPNLTLFGHYMAAQLPGSGDGFLGAAETDPSLVYRGEKDSMFLANPQT